MNTNSKIKSFTDLMTWQKSHLLVLEIYKITKQFPKDERYGLTDQIRRCAVSISSNIAEGFSRRGNKEKLQFYFMAKGSTTELQNQLLIARDVGYIDKMVFSKVADLSIEVNKLLNSLVKSLKNDAKY